ncbi:hypothetical protein OOZ15_08725 [Galbibacter sp. EGI 63066]|uniref:hypothetical protein n=1 Tax=Galbibacter sp. EGI 63066 TaxID=2993559 RepID=UPI002248D1B0|nr:hypothetical protein [Galbibacter sp. EGI 63066]MCX2680018.1 hypothetical protein [Galbibacter sp. EGI 63066]
MQTKTSSFKSSKDDRARLHVLVFASTINQEDKVDRISCELLKIEGVYSVNVDLEDWENILRVECESERLSEIIKEKVSKLGFACKELV